MYIRYAFGLSALTLSLLWQGLVHADAGVSIFADQIPAMPAANDGVPYELGMKFRPAAAGQVVALRFWKSDADPGPHIGHLWSADGTELAAVEFTNETASGWQAQTLIAPVAVNAATTYVVSVNNNVYFPITAAGLANSIVNGSLASVADGGNGIFGAPGSFPANSYNNSNYFRDVIFQAGSVSAVAPVAADGTSTPVADPVATTTGTTDTTVAVTTPVSFSDPASSSADATVVAVPDSTVTAAQTDNISSAAPATTTGSTAAAAPVSAAAPIAGPSTTLFTTQLPNSPNATDSGASYELGMKFKPTASGIISALRYYRSSVDTGGHVGHLWSETGEPLATVTFSNETASGWQEQALESPVSVTAGTTYVVSVNNNAYFPITPAGLATPVVNGNLSSVADGANGVFGAPGAFPAGSYNNGNYFRDVVFQEVQIGVPAKLAITPNTSSLALGSSATLTVTIQDSNGVTVPNATDVVSLLVAADSTGSGVISPSNAVASSNGQAVFTFTPTVAGTVSLVASAGALQGAGTTLTVTDSANTVFTTQTPALANASDSGASYEMGMKFRPTAGGQIRALRYYRSPNDTGSHVGHLWSAAGTALATVTFKNETASGWQEQALTTPVTVNANTTYVVSVNANRYFPMTQGGLATPVVNGNLSSVADGANGVFGAPGAFPTSSYSNSNYFRDVAFTGQPAGNPAKLALTAAKLSTPLNVPVTYTVTVQDANGQKVTTATNSVTFKASGVTGGFSVPMPVAAAGGAATVTFTPSSVGTGTITATSQGLTGSSVSLNVTAAVSNNFITVENQLAGTSGWRISNPVTESAPEIAGYASATSVNAGSTLPLKVSLATAGNYSIKVYRLGYYGGLGGRLMGSSGTLAGTKQSACLESDPVTHLIECNWSTSYTLNVGSNWTSGLYVANLTAAASGKQSQIWFVVRNDSSNSDILFQSSFTTFLAYNSYGSTTFRSLYGFNSTNGQPALKVSFDRPFGQVTTDQARYDNMLKHERNMVMWLESQGYNVSYSTDLDTHEHPERLLTHRVFLSVGHDEYWSLEMRNGVEAARDAGVNLGFFAGNSAYWRVRFEPSSSGQANRVMVCYKNPLLNDPVAPTYLWRGPANNRPENALLGVMYVGDDVATIYGGYNHVVTSAADPYYANTGFVNGNTATGLVGFEWDAVVNNGFTPPGLVKLSASTPTATEVPPIPAGLTTGPSKSNVVRYTAASGAKVFSTGSIQWMWGLNDDGVVNSRADRRIQQMTVNVLADMNARPVTPADNLIVP